MTFNDYEKREMRQVAHVTGVMVYTRFYGLPVPVAANLVPAEGTIMQGETDNVVAARVKRITYADPDKKGIMLTRVVYWKPVARTA